ncbi:MAG: type II toxin-antitoxin system prevent-host-death family antitoxin [Pseudoclavibacter sp.]|nr:type II toxin-antitoxin system prevent-host-death family antitoxin [Pseudoclavibacter sp.]
MRATLCDVETITHREMRNRSAEVLRRVEAGESLRVSNGGRPVALLVPIGQDPIEDLLARGAARPARRKPSTLLEVPRARAGIGTRELLEDTRGQW